MREKEWFLADVIQATVHDRLHIEEVLFQESTP